MWYLNYHFFLRIQSTWVGQCELANARLPKGVFTEFSKRSSKAKKSKGEKAKLDFSGCHLNDQMVTILVRVLSVGPLIAKLDLRNNDISNEVILNEVFVSHERSINHMLY